MNISLYEKFDKKRLEQVINCSNIPYDESDDSTWKKNLKTSLKRLLKKKYTKRGVVISYNQISAYGRYYADGGLQGIQKDIRKYIAGDFHKDIDIQNCHPVILKQLFKNFKIDGGEFLDEYINNRDRCMKRYKIKDKVEFIKMMNNENEPLKEYFKDLHSRIYDNLVKVLLTEEVNKRLYNRIIKQRKKEGKDYNHKGSFLCLYIQNIENNILQVIYKKLIELNIVVHTLMFDGLTVDVESIEDVQMESLLKNLEEEVYEVLKYKITLVEKSTKTDWVPVINDPTDEEVDSDNENMLSCMGDRKIARLFYEKYKEMIIIDENQNWYVLNEYGIWKKEFHCLKAVNALYDKFEQHLLEKDISDSLYKRLQTSSFKNSILKECEHLFFVESKIFNKNPYIFPFDNGVYDLKTCCFRKGKYDEYINMTCGYSYKYEDSTKARIFYEDFLIDSETRSYYLAIVASHLADVQKREEFIIKTGTGQNGKSKENQLLAYVFGNFAYTCKSSMLICNNNENAEGASPVILGMKNKRIILYQEIKEGKILDSETIKRLSGGDRINARNLYQAGTDEFYINGCQMLGCNDIPGFDRIDDATIRRIIIIACITKFVMNPVEKNERQSKELNMEDLKHSMFQLLVEHLNITIPKEYDSKPEFVKRSIEMYLGKKDDIKRFVRDFIEKKEDEYIKRSELKAIFNSSINKTEYNLKKMNYDKFEELIIKELKTEIKTKYKNGQRNCIVGYSLKNEYDIEE